jgi:hypothetical protein
MPVGIPLCRVVVELRNGRHGLQRRQRHQGAVALKHPAGDGTALGKWLDEPLPAPGLLGRCHGQPVLVLSRSPLGAVAFGNALPNARSGDEIAIEKKSDYEYRVVPVR